MNSEKNLNCNATLLNKKLIIKNSRCIVIVNCQNNYIFNLFLHK